MYENFKKLLEEKNLTAYKVAKGTGISQATFSDWKKGRSQPKIDKLQKIANYLNVDIECLLDGQPSSRKRKRKKTQTSQQHIPEELVHIMASKTENLTEAQKKKLFEILIKTIDDVISFIEK